MNRYYDRTQFLSQQEVKRFGLSPPHPHAPDRTECPATNSQSLAARPQIEVNAIGRPRSYDYTQLMLEYQKYRDDHFWTENLTIIEWLRQHTTVSERHFRRMRKQFHSGKS